MSNQRLTAVKAVATISRIREIPLYVVGGTVRDILMGLESRDIDMLVFGDVWKVASELAVAIDGSWFVLDEFHRQLRVLSRGFPELNIDLVESKHQALGDNLRERDFTINAMALDVFDYQQYLSTGDRQRTVEQVVDPGRGRMDIDSRLIRLNHPRAFASDPLRLLRAPRLAGKLGFEIEPDTRRAIVENSELLRQTAPERIRDEVYQILSLENSSDLIETLHDLGLIKVIFPELSSTVGVNQNDHHALDVWEHSVTTLRCLESRPWNGLNLDSELHGHLLRHLENQIVEGRSRHLVLKMAALLHDVGKPLVREVKPDGRVTFYRHETVGGGIVSTIARRLRLSRKEERLLNTVVTHHLRPLHLFLAKNHTEKAEYRFFKQLGDESVSILLLSLADRSAGKPDKKNQEIKEYFRFSEHLIKKYYREYKPAAGRRFIGGEDLIEVFGLSPGPQIGKILDWVEEAQVERRVQTREDALELVGNIISTAGIEQPKKRD